MTAHVALTARDFRGLYDTQRHTGTEDKSIYKGHQIGAHRPDLVVEDGVVVDVKSVERLIGVHRAQALTYMRMLRVPLGLVLNFNSEVLRHGIERLRI
jgi:GxxExxY protein